jgi:N-sulfoglucosamine sulfohydrolase
MTVRLITLLSLALVSTATFADDRERPNVLWILAEDLCPDFACYGNPDIATPRIDHFAADGVL